MKKTKQHFDESLDNRKRRQLLEAFRNALGLGNIMVQAEVEAVDKDKRTCNVKLPNDTQIFNVQLAALKEAGKAPVMFPKKDSTVWMITLGATDWLVVSMEEVDEIQYDAENDIKINGKTIQLNGDSNGGLVILKKLENNLDKLDKKLTKLQTAVATGLTAVGASTAANGATGATAFNNAMAGSVITFDPMENTKVTH